MKSLFALGFAFFAFTTANAYAVNINGNWKGAGKITDNRGLNIPCESMEVAIVHTATVLNVSSTFTCKGQRATSPGGNLEIRGTELWENGAKVGTITANAVTIAVKDAQHSLNTQCSFTEKEMTFHVVSTDAADAGHVITFDGKVTR